MRLKQMFRVGTMIAFTLILSSILSLRAQDRVVVNFWSHDYPARVIIDEELIAQFEAENPDIDIVYTVGPGDDVLYITQLLTALAGGQGPDLFNVVGVGVPDLIPSGAVVPVDVSQFGVDDQQAIIDLYAPGVLDSFMSEDGTLFALPTELGNYALYINTALFEAAGLDAEADAPATWEDILELAEILTVRDANGSITQRAFDFPYPLADEFNSRVIVMGGMAYQLGDGIVADDNLTVTLNGPGWVRTMEFVRNYAANYGGPQMPSAFTDFLQGKVAMIISGSWFEGVVAANNPALLESLIVAPFPRWAEGLVNDGGSYLYGYGLYVSAQASPEVQAAAWKFVNFISSFPERYYTEANLLQPRLSLLENDEVVNASFAAPFLRDMVGSPSLPLVKGGGEGEAVLGRAIEAVTLTNRPIQEILDEVTADFQASIDAAQ
ncbi:MAG: extracellular solute-binding protein [Anaerolinea sp.]